MRSKQINRPEYAPRDQRGIFLGVLLDVLPEGDQLTYRPAGPNDPHLGAFVSPALPQEFSHFATFS